MTPTTLTGFTKGRG